MVQDIFVSCPKSDVKTDIHPRGNRAHHKVGRSLHHSHLKNVNNYRSNRNDIFEFS